jgi:hypothetical protein
MLDEQLLTQLNNLDNLVNLNVFNLECDVGEYIINMSLVTNDVKAIVTDRSGNLVHSLIKVDNKWENA